MDCAALCLLTMAVGFSPAKDTTGCSYCVEARSTYSECFSNVIDCAYSDPKSLIFCLNTYEKKESELIDHSLKCISYAEFYISDADILAITDTGVCKYKDVQDCGCDVCAPNTTTTTTTTTTTVSTTSRATRSRPKILRGDDSSSVDVTLDGNNNSKGSQSTSHKHRSVSAEHGQTYFASVVSNSVLQKNVILSLFLTLFLVR